MQQRECTTEDPPARPCRDAEEDQQHRRKSKLCAERPCPNPPPRVHRCCSQIVIELLPPLAWLLDIGFPEVEDRRERPCDRSRDMESPDSVRHQLPVVDLGERLTWRGAHAASREHPRLGHSGPAIPAGRRRDLIIQRLDDVVRVPTKFSARKTSDGLIAARP
jgi:hypothetical protein